MLYHKHSNRTDILKGLQIDEPMIFLPWNIDEKGFIAMFENHNMSLVVEKQFFVRGVTIFGESRCNIGVTFDRTIRKVGISRDNYGGYNSYVKSFAEFQSALVKAFGQPNMREIVLDDFESCEWEISDSIKIYHYVMDRFGLEEHLYIEHR